MGFMLLKHSKKSWSFGLAPGYATRTAPDLCSVISFSIKAPWFFKEAHSVCRLASRKKIHFNNQVQINTPLWCLLKSWTLFVALLENTHASPVREWGEWGSAGFLVMWLSMCGRVALRWWSMSSVGQKMIKENDLRGFVFSQCPPLSFQLPGGGLLLVMSPVLRDWSMGRSCAFLIR